MSIAEQQDNIVKLACEHLQEEGLEVTHVRIENNYPPQYFIVFKIDNRSHITYNTKHRTNRWRVAGQRNTQTLPQAIVKIKQQLGNNAIQ